MRNPTLSGTLLAVVVLGLATVYGLLRRRRDGRLRSVGPVTARQPDGPLAAQRLAGPVTAGPVGAMAAAGEAQLDPALLATLKVTLDAPVTLLQFSSAFCAPCRATRRVLSEVTGMLDGVQHVEVDAESQLSAVRALDIWRTPTTLVLGPGGRIVARAFGVPAKAQVIATVAPLLVGDRTGVAPD